MDSEWWENEEEERTYRERTRDQPSFNGVDRDMLIRMAERQRYMARDIADLKRDSATKAEVKPVAYAAFTLGLTFLVGVLGAILNSVMKEPMF